MAKDGAMPQDPHAEKRIAKLSALLEYLVDPTEEKEQLYCIRCDELASEMGNYSSHRALVDVYIKNSLKDKEVSAWVNLFNEISEFDSLKNLYQQAVKKYGLSIEAAGGFGVSIQTIAVVNQ